MFFNLYSYTISRADDRNRMFDNPVLFTELSGKYAKAYCTVIAELEYTSTHLKLHLLFAGPQ